MASAQPDPNLMSTVRKTQKLLGEHIYKPVLLEKHLVKPTFHYLFDIVCSVIHNTGFMKDVFAQDELKYENVKNADDKRNFLRKVIEAVEATSGNSCPARISKILAGKEPENTNKLLHLLAKVITKSNKKENSETTKKHSKKENSKKDNVAAPSSSVESKPPEQNPTDKDLKKKSRSRPLPKASTTPSKSKVSASPSKDKGVADKKQNKEKVKSIKIEGKPPPPSSTPSKTKVISKTNLQKTASKTSTSHARNSRKESKENITKSSSVARLSSTSIGAIPNTDSKNDACLPPVPIAKVPLQRPVSRTKYRQGDGAATSAVESSSSKDDLLDAASRSTPVEEHVTPATANSTEEVQESSIDQIEQISNPINDVVVDEIEEENDSEDSATLSDELATEHMNQKISEWSKKAVGDEMFPPQHDRFSSEDVSKVENKSTGKVFQSEENYSLIKDTEKEKGNSTINFKTAVEEKPSGAEKVFSANEIQNETFKRPVTVIMDNEDEDDEDEMYLIQEHKKESLEDMMKMNVGFLNIVTGGGLLSEGNRSLLVNQILETKKELEKLNTQGSSDMENALAVRDQELLKEIYLKQVEDLKDAIQKITKCANPLSNIAQRSQDDACLIEIEYRKLKQENERLQRKIDEAKEETSRILYPYTEELISLDNCIEKMEAAIALANQRLHMMDEEYTEDFIEQIAQTPTGDEIMEDNSHTGMGERDGATSIKQHQLWGGIPPAEVLRHDEEHEHKMRTLSLKNTFQLAIDMHEHRSIVDRSGRKLLSNKTVLLSHARSRSKPIQMQHFPFQQQHHNQNPFQMNYGRMQNPEMIGMNNIFGGPNGVVAMIPSQRGAPMHTQPQQYQFNHQLHHHQQQPQQQPNFGFERNDIFRLPQQIPQKEPHVETDIRPSWWD